MRPVNLRCEYLKNPQGVDVAKPRLSWQLTAEGATGLMQKAYRIRVASSPETLAKNDADLWDSGLVDSDRSVLVPYDGQSLASRTRCFWKVQCTLSDGTTTEWSEPAQWTMGLMKPADWTAKWISMKQEGSLTSHDSPMLRKAFKIDKPVVSAQVSICGLGYYEMFLNGEKVGDHVLDPGLTCYHVNAHYVTYDISSELKQGMNALGVQLANGIYNQEFPDAWDFHKAPWRAFPQMLLQLDVVYEDGSNARIVSDETWKTSTGPITWDQLRMGVMYDARREQPAWSTAGFDDASWSPAVVREGITGRLSAQMCEPIRVMKTLKVKEVKKGNGFYMFDFGQNIAGWSRLRVTGPAGTAVTMDHGSHALVKGKPLQTEIYTLKGGGEEVWEPGFTYHGFGKVKVSGLPQPPDERTLEARVAHTSFDERGAFECSNELINKIVEATRWSYIGNFVGIPTDCPHREKNGWTGDAQVASVLGLLYYGPEAAYTRWMLDMQAIQRKDGKLPCIVPTGGWGFNRLDGPAWEIAYLMIPWHIYEYRGDRRLFEIHYENYKRWLDWYRKHPKANQGHIIHYGLGDWVPIKTKTPAAITSTGYYYAAAKRLSEIAQLLGKTADRDAYAALAEEIRKAFNREFYDPETGLYGEGSQTAMSCALYHGMVAPGERDKVVAKLVESIRRNDYALDCGFLGSKYLLRALSDNGHTDVAYRMVIKDDTPGWGKMIRSGNTTLWETFKCNNSDNHVFLGDLVAWFMNTFAGIRLDPAHPGFQRFIIKPEVVGDLTWVKSHHDSPYGRIESSWKIKDGKFMLDVTVPVNSIATVILPGETEGREVGSGTHKFSVALK